MSVVRAVRLGAALIAAANTSTLQAASTAFVFNECGAGGVTATGARMYRSSESRRRLGLVRGGD